jgi:aminoglycoside phosphotransferase (APT) family kinase protein
MFVMSYFPPDKYPVWKAELRDGRVDLDFIDRVGRDLAHIHSATAGNHKLAEQFANDSNFHAIRLEPYLEATAAKYDGLAPALLALSSDTLRRHVALVHGDMSPKNILVGKDGPIFLDAECAVYGDPAFDLAFCLNHILLKCVWNREAAPRLLAGFDRLQDNYLSTAAYEGAADVERRAAALLPALLLARIDGKSPVEYITTDDDRDLVRKTVLPLIAEAPEKLQVIRNVWAGSLAVAL